jgi:hypothetical protein
MDDKERSEIAEKVISIEIIYKINGFQKVCKTHTE